MFNDSRNEFNKVIGVNFDSFPYLVKHTLVLKLKDFFEEFFDMLLNY